MGSRATDGRAGQGADAVLLRAPRRRTSRSSARSWSCTPTRPTTRSSPTPTGTSRTSTRTSSRSATRSSTGRKPVDGSDPGDRLAGRALVRREPERGQPEERLAVQHEQLAMVRGRARQPEGVRLSALLRSRRREPARRARDQVLQGKKDFTLDTLRDAAFDSYLPEFDALVPALVKAYDQLAASSPLKTKLKATRSSCCASGTSAGRRTRCPTRWPSSGARSCGGARRPRRRRPA